MLDPRIVFACGLLCVLQGIAAVVVVAPCMLSSMRSRLEEMNATQYADRICTLAKESIPHES